MALFKRRVKSALYIDFENVPLNADQIGNVIAWLEDGLFDEARQKRALVERRVYWNSQAIKHKKAFEDHKFEVVLIEKYGGLKNGADIRIAMDMVEATFRRKQIEEFILISKDSDFVPVIQRLGEKDRRTIMMVEEQQPAAYTAYDLHADGIIPHRRLIHEAQTYQRPSRGLMEKLGLKRKPIANGAATGAKVPVKPTPAIKTKVTTGQPTLGVTAGVDLPQPAMTAAAKKQMIDQAVDAFVKVASRTPGKLTGKQTILKQLKTIKGFTNTGSKPYFGFKTYEALAKEVAGRDARITLQEDRLGGITIVYVPDDATSEVASVDDVKTAPSHPSPAIEPASVSQTEKQPTS
jgi:uncharacterized LabA/DUF88 family protein